MVLVSGNQQLSQTNVKTLTQRCVELISKAACIDEIRREAIQPVLEYYASREPKKTLANDSVFLAWRLLRQGAMLCLLLNNFRSGILESLHKLPEAGSIGEDSFNGPEAHDNIKKFLAACRDDLYMTEDQLFGEAALYTDDTNTLSKAIAITDSFFVRIGKIQGVVYERRIEELQANDVLYALSSPEERSSTAQGSSQDRDLRLRVLMELLETEQKYVADLDKLQNYAEELRLDQIISTAAHRAIFCNLDALVDFHRRFLMQMEGQLTKTALNDLKASYKAGVAQLFISNEAGFAKVYEEFCPGYPKAIETVAAELQNLKKKERIMDPNVVLNAYLIKPTQRLCKYPLLLREVIKQSTKDAPDLKELNKAFDVVNRITMRVNEKKRKAEMAIKAEEMDSLIRDWKGIDRTKIGDLLLYEQANIQMGDNSKDLEVFLFEKLMIMCSKSKSMADIFSGASRRPSQNQLLVIKGHIYISQIISVAPLATDTNALNAIKMTYRDGPDIGYCAIRFNMEEKVKTWLAILQPLLEMARIHAAPEISIKERRRRSIIAAVPAAAPNRPAHVEVPTVAEEEPFRLKVIFDEDIFALAVYRDITTLQDLKELVLGKIQAAYRVMDRPFLLAAQNIQLKYIDEQKDQISLLDDTDVDTALLFTPHALTIRVVCSKDGGHISITSHSSEK